MSAIITANQLKTKGIAAIKEATANSNEAIITVRGKEEFVIMPINHYNRLREYELEGALLESQNDITAGKFIEESVEEHIKRISRA